MSSDQRAAIIKETARQLGVGEDQIAPDTVIPDIHTLVTNVGVEIDECGFVNVERGAFTVSRACKLYGV